VIKEQHSESFKIRLAIFRINTEGFAPLGYVFWKKRTQTYFLTKSDHYNFEKLNFYFKKTANTPVSGNIAMSV